MESVHHVLSTYEQYIAGPLGEYGHGANRSMPYDAVKFHDTIHLLPPGKFLDVGCGIGSKLLQAQSLGWTVTGLEIYKPYVEAARVICPTAEVIHVDALKYVDYDKYDLVYMWTPCVEDADNAELERHIFSHMKQGAIAYFPDAVTGPEYRVV